MPRVAACVLLVVFAATARAERHYRLSLWGAAELTLRPQLDGHGIFLVRYELEGALPRNGRLVVDYNSDTLRLGLNHFQFGRVELGAVAGGEALIAGLLTDYWRDGKNDSKRSFFASWVSAGTYVKIDIAPSYLELSVSARRWFFNRGTASAALTLPPEAWVGEWRLRYTLWQLAPDPSLWEAQRPFPRVRGVAFGVELGPDERSAARPWGARDASFSPPDLRNSPKALVLSARQWLRAGARLSARVRIQFEELAVWMSGADDLDRVRLGGSNPYSVPLVGTPWPEYLASKLAAAQLTLHIMVWRELELGPLVDAAVVDDVARTGNPLKPGVLAGVGAFLDAPPGRLAGRRARRLFADRAQRLVRCSWRSAAAGGADGSVRPWLPLLLLLLPSTARADAAAAGPRRRAPAESGSGAAVGLGGGAKSFRYGGVCELLRPRPLQGRQAHRARRREELRLRRLDRRPRQDAGAPSPGRGERAVGAHLARRQEPAQERRDRGALHAALALGALRRSRHQGAAPPARRRRRNADHL